MEGICSHDSLSPWVLEAWPAGQESCQVLVIGDTCCDACCDKRPGQVADSLFIFSLKFQQTACLLGEILEAHVPCESGCMLPTAVVGNLAYRVDPLYFNNEMSPKSGFDSLHSNLRAV